MVTERGSAADRDDLDPVSELVESSDAGAGGREVDRWQAALSEIYRTAAPVEPEPGAGVPEEASVSEAGGSADSTDATRGDVDGGWSAERDRAAEVVCAHLEVTDPERRRAVAEAYGVSREYTAPFVVKLIDDMLGDLRSDVERNPDARAVFVGRDGHGLAVAARRLDPELMAEHGREVVLSRAVAEAAVQDLEANAGRQFPQLHDFRAAAGKVAPEDVDGARLRLSQYLQEADVPVGRAGSEVVLVDTSYKGTVQELLTAAFPKTHFEGRYVFFAASPHDPHPDAKRGYALDLDAEHGYGGRPVAQLDTGGGQAAPVLAHQDAIGVIEETLHGPYTSPQRIGEDRTGPEQGLHRGESDPLSGLNPLRVDPAYTDPRVREAVMAVNLIAVADHADQVAKQRAAGVPVGPDLQAGFDRYVAQVRSWIEGSDQADPAFAKVMDSFVRRADKSHVRQVAELVERAGLTPAEAGQVWSAYDAIDTTGGRAAFAQELTGRFGTQEDR